MKITNTILKALDKAIKAAGNKSQLAHKSGVSKSLIGKYVKQEITDITLENLYKLKPFLKPYLNTPIINHSFVNMTPNTDVDAQISELRNNIEKKILNNTDLNEKEKIKIIKFVDNEFNIRKKILNSTFWRNDLKYKIMKIITE